MGQQCRLVWERLCGHLGLHVFWGFKHSFRTWACNVRTIILQYKNLSGNIFISGVRKDGILAGSLRCLWFAGSSCTGSITRELSLYQILRTWVYKQEVMVLKRWLDGNLIAGVGLAIRSGVMSLEVHWEVKSWVETFENLPKELCLVHSCPWPLLHAPIAMSLMLLHRIKKPLPDPWEYSLEFFDTVQNTCQQANNNLLSQSEEKPGNFVIKVYFSFSGKHWTPGEIFRVK